MEGNRNLLILGAGQYGRVAKETAEESGAFTKISFLDDKYDETSPHDDCIIGKLSDYVKFTSEYSYAFVSVGNVDTRLKYIEKLQKACFSVAKLISNKAYVAPSARIASGCIIEAMAVVNANSAISTGTFVCAGVVVNHDNVVGDGCTLQCGSVVPANSIVPPKTIVGYNEVYTEKTSNRWDK